MATVPRLAAHVGDIAERLANILTTLGALELAQASGGTFDVSILRPPLERALAHTEGLLAELQMGNV